MSQKIKLSDDLPLPIDAVTQTFLIVGKRGSGKSNSAARLVEQFIGARLPVVVLDVTDTWWGLKAGRDGGRGLDVYVFGGRKLDLPLEAGGGALIAEVLCEHRLSMVLSVKHLSGRERSRFMVAFAQTLFQKWAGGPLHVVLEEAHELAPQMSGGRGQRDNDDGEAAMLGAFKRLWKLGRASGIGGTAVTQRPASLSKDITTQSEILIAHRTIGPQDVKAIGEWVKYHGEHLDILGELPSLPTGRAIVWAPEFPEGQPLGLVRTNVLLRETYDSASTPKVGEKRVEPKELAPVDLERLRVKMSATIEKAKADDPRELRKQIAELKKQLSASSSHPPASKVETKTVEKFVLTDADRAVLRGLDERIRDVGGLVRSEFAERLTDFQQAVLTAVDRKMDGFARVLDSKGFQKILDKLAAVQPQPIHPIATTAQRRPSPVSPHARRVAPALAQATSSRPARVVSPESSNGNLAKVERVFLSVLAQREHKTTARNQLAVFAGYSAKSRHVDNTISGLRTKGYLFGSSAALEISADGLAALGSDWEPLPSGQALINYWIANAGGAAEAAMLGALVKVYPNAMTRDELAEASNYSVTSRHVDNTISRLRTLDLVVGDRSALKASDELFDRRAILTAGSRDEERR